MNLSDPFGLMACDEQANGGGGGSSEDEGDPPRRGGDTGGSSECTPVRGGFGAAGPHDPRGQPGTEFAMVGGFGRGGTLVQQPEVATGEAFQEALDNPVGGLAVGAAAGVGSAPRIFQALFRPGGLLNANRYLRIGISRHGGQKVFSIRGKLIERFKPDNPHIDLFRLGPWGR